MYCIETARTFANLADVLTGDLDATRDMLRQLAHGKDAVHPYILASVALVASEFQSVCPANGSITIARKATMPPMFAELGPAVKTYSRLLQQAVDQLASGLFEPSLSDEIDRTLAASTVEDCLDLASVAVVHLYGVINYGTGVTYWTDFDLNTRGYNT
jgi:hypothetical protein